MSRRKRSTMPAPRPVGPAVGVVLAASVVLGWLALPATAEEEIVIQPETVVSGEPGSKVSISTVPVPGDMVGQPCDLRVATRNGSSVHPGNSVIVTTGGDRIEITGIEDSALGTVFESRRLELGDEIVVEVHLGPDGWSSLGFSLGFECTPDSLAPVVQPADQLPAEPPATEPPATEPPVAAPPVTAPLTTAPPPTVAIEAPVPTVLPSRVEAPALPQAEPARATPANPNFTG